MSFLPDNYSMPTDSNYMKFEQGANKFRVLGQAIVGTEYWKTGDDGKRRPVRVRPGVKISVAELEVNPKTNEPETPKHFWAFPVWNYQASRVQILELTQKSIMNAITAYVENEDWGDPKDYDITVTKNGQGLETEYQVIASPHKKISQEIVEAFLETKVNVEALYDGADPFAQE